MIGLPILVVEDEERVRDWVLNALRQAGFAVDVALARHDILERARSQACAAIVLDLGLPGDDGMNIARAVRQISPVPILMLTGRAGIHSRVAGFEAGADDYLVKPFAPEELVARLRAILRRVPQVMAQEAARAVRLGSTRLDLATAELTGPRGTARLTAREARLVLALARSAGPLSREATYHEVFQRPWDPSDRSLDVHVANLRRKLEGVCEEPTVIAAVRGQGYELRVSATIEAGERPA